MFRLSIRELSSVAKLSISNIFKHECIGKNIQVEGWVKSLRKMKENTFIDISDGSTSLKLQIIAPHLEKTITPGASIKADGILEKTPKGQLELKAENIAVVGQCVVTDGYPFAPRKTYPQEYIRQHLHFRPRTNRFSSLLRLRSYAQFSIHNYFHKNGYFLVNAPVLTSNDCEGAGEIFKVAPNSNELLKLMSKSDQLNSDQIYFNTKTYLTVSGQLHLEAAAHGLGKVYNLGPTFRAENSKSRFHLSEFYMLEAEIAFLQDIESLINTVEDLLKNVTRQLVEKYENEIESSQEEKTDYSWIEKKFCVITYDDAVRVLAANNRNVHKKEGLIKEDEYFIVKHCGNIPTFVINWPKDIKPFYMKECPEDPTKVAAFDLLVPNIGELVGGSLREDDYEKLKERIGPFQDDLQWYLDVRKFGGVPTGGFGLGFERYLQFILGISNIKDTIPYPRWPHNCKL